MEAHVSLQANAPEDAKFYVVVQGSRLTHITTAKRGDDGLTLRFTVPGMMISNTTTYSLSLLLSHCFQSRFTMSPLGHDSAEVCSVTSYFYAVDQVRPCEAEVSLEYLRDVAQEAAEYLSANRNQLGSQSYLEFLKRFSVLTAEEELSADGLDCKEEDAQLRQVAGVEANLRQLDEKITYAMANMDYPQQWKNTDSQLRDEGNETGSSSGTCELWSCRFF